LPDDLSLPCVRDQMSFRARRFDQRDKTGKSHFRIESNRLVLLD